MSDTLTASDEVYFVGLFLESFFYGLYSGLFAMYLQVSKRDASRTQNIIYYSICILYALSVAVFVCDIAFLIISLLGRSVDLTLHIAFIQAIAFGFCDFIAQFILIYRCWIVWGRNSRVVIIPSILALAFLATWIAYSYSSYILLGLRWTAPLLFSSLVPSPAANALVTGLIVYRIFTVFRQAKTTMEDQILAPTASGSKLRHIIFVLIESDMALFSIQLVRLVVTIVHTDAAFATLNYIVGIHEMLNGITPTIILVRTSIGLSFDDEKSMEEFAVESLRFASSHPNPETGGISTIAGQDNRDNDIGI